MNDEAPKEAEEAQENETALADTGALDDSSDAWSGGEGGAEALAPAGEEGGVVNIDMILDLPLQVVVELGRTKMLINDLLQIGQGSVIELNKQVGEPLDVLVNGKLVARGEVVVVREKFGIRITDVISPIERIKQLG